jgi:hypothetical protein
MGTASLSDGIGHRDRTMRIGAVDSVAASLRRQYV